MNTKYRVGGLTGMLNGVGNILPFDQSGDDGSATLTTAFPTTTPSTTRSPRKVRRSAGAETTLAPGDFNNETETAEYPTCCENVTGLCDWIEPVGWMCVDEEQRKKTVWTEADCLLIYPDDINSYTDRFNAWKDEQKRQANELVRTTNNCSITMLSNSSERYPYTKVPV
jgi:hypothetical protein